MIKFVEMDETVTLAALLQEEEKGVEGTPLYWLTNSMSSPMM